MFVGFILGIVVEFIGLCILSVYVSRKEEENERIKKAEKSRKEYLKTKKKLLKEKNAKETNGPRTRNQGTKIRDTKKK